MIVDMNDLAFLRNNHCSKCPVPFHIYALWCVNGLSLAHEHQAQGFSSKAETL